MVTYTFSNGTLADANEVNKNFEDVEDSVDSAKAAALGATGGLSAELAYKGQQVTGWENGDSTAAEKYTTASGLQGTVNTGSTTADFNNDKYILSSSGTTTNDVFWSGSISKLYTSNINGKKIIPTTTIILQKVNLLSGLTSGIDVAVLDSSGTLLQKGNRSGNIVTFNIMLESGKTYQIVSYPEGSSYELPYINVIPTYPINKTNFDIVGDRGLDRESLISSVDTKTVIFNTSSSIIHDSNTLPIDDETDSFVLHWAGDFPAGTSGSFDLSDGSSTGDGINDTTNAATEDDETGSASNSLGLYINPNEKCKLKSVSKRSSSTATRCRLFTSSGSLLNTASFSGNVATFTSPTLLLSGIDYIIECDNSSSSYTYTKDNNNNGAHTYTYPIVGTCLDLIKASNNQADGSTGTIYNIASIITETATENPSINLPVNTTTKKTEIVSKGSLTNVDNIIIKQKLATTDTSVTPTAKGWGLVKL